MFSIPATMRYVSIRFSNVGRDGSPAPETCPHQRVREKIRHSRPGSVAAKADHCLTPEPLAVPERNALLLTAASWVCTGRELEGSVHCQPSTQRHSCVSQ